MDIFSKVKKHSVIKADLHIYNMDDEFLAVKPLGKRELIPNGKRSKKDLLFQSVVVFAIVPVTSEIVKVYMAKWGTGKFEDTVVYKREYESMRIKDE